MSGSSSSSSPQVRGALDAGRREEPQVGGLIGGRYRLEELLGRGGMGSVFAAEDTKRGVRVALKLMHAHLGTLREAQRRFRHEASALHRLRSRHIARLYDFGHHQDGAPFLVMEHVPGHDLTREVSTHGKLSWTDAHAIIEHVCLALEAVHTAGLVHRDLKPRNIIVSRAGEVLLAKVVDFGLSKSHLRSARVYTPITRAGMAVGSLHYMAPEQAVGSPYVDARADVFSVGCILYFLLMGEPPFSQRALARAGRSGSALTFASIHHRRPDVPSYVDEVLRVALAPDPDHRFRTIGALRIALSSDIPMPVSPAPSPPTPPAAYAARVRTMPLVALILTALVIAAMLIARAIL